MVSSLKFFFTILLLSFVGKGLSQVCSLDNLNIDQHRTDRIIQGKPEWNVTVINNCNCSRQGMAFSCAGFKTAEPIDPAIFKPIDNGLCAVLPNKLLKPHDTVKFAYAWDPPFIMFPRRATSVC
ncbi:hypothetical protein CsSME_00043923 [Camellia sinensis var. sinensis]